MAISYPLNLPAGNWFRELSFMAASAVTRERSPFTFESQDYVHQGQIWRAEGIVKPLRRPDAAIWRGFFLSLNIREGTFMMGHPVETSPIGTWAGSPKVLGAQAAGVTSIPMDGFTAAATVKAGDRFQTGGGSTAHLHEVTQDAVADGSGLLTLEIWPRLRAALADNDTFITSSPKGLWQLDMDQAQWSYVIGQIHKGFAFSASEKI
jgi:hypothetical protein